MVLRFINLRTETDVPTKINGREADLVPTVGALVNLPIYINGVGSQKMMRVAKVLFNYAKGGELCILVEDCAE